MRSILKNVKGNSDFTLMNLVTNPLREETNYSSWGFASWLTLRFNQNVLEQYLGEKKL
jgi:hypothetical protein